MFKNASHAPSFKIVSCYKHSRTILNFFEHILKAYTRAVPNRAAIIQDWAHQSLICYPFYPWWTSVNISSQEAKGPISLCANTDMCIPLQIICDSDPKILDAFDIFEDYSLQSIWSMDLFDPFPCYLHHIAFDRLKSHTPFSYPASQLIHIFLTFQCVLCILNFSVANTFIRKESYYRINVCWDIINVQKTTITKNKTKNNNNNNNNKGLRTVPCWTPDKTQSDFAPFTKTLLSVAQKKLSISVSSDPCHSQSVYS